MFTQGEWKVAENTGVIICDGYEVARAAGGWGDTLKEQMKTRQANAHLISASPDMYNALVRIKNIAIADGMRITRPDIIEQVEQAIAKAEGKL